LSLIYSIGLSSYILILQQTKDLPYLPSQNKKATDIFMFFTFFLLSDGSIVDFRFF
jgi:hypothetical protein